MNELAFKVPGINTEKPIEIFGLGGMSREGTLLTNTLPALITYLLIAATLLALFFIIFGGIRWIISGGDKTAVESARKMITFAILGLVISFLSFFIINTIGSFFGEKLINVPRRAAVCSDKNRNGTCPEGKICKYSEDDGHWRCRLACDPSRGFCPD